MIYLIVVVTFLVGVFLGCLLGLEIAYVGFTEALHNNNPQSDSVREILRSYGWFKKQ